MSLQVELSEIHILKAELLLMSVECDALRVDAERYRYMRDFPYNNIARAVGITDGRHYWLQFDAADAAIDKAMSDDCQLLACMTREQDQ